MAVWRMAPVASTSPGSSIDTVRQKHPIVAIHPSAWKRNSRKLACPDGVATSVVPSYSWKRLTCRF